MFCYCHPRIRPEKKGLILMWHINLICLLIFLLVNKNVFVSSLLKTDGSLHTYYVVLQSFSITYLRKNEKWMVPYSYRTSLHDNQLIY